VQRPPSDQRERRVNFGAGNYLKGRLYKMSMAEIITINKIYDELKTIERKMVTKEGMERILETIEILSNQDAMEQIRQSEEDIRTGSVKEVISDDPESPSNRSVL